MSFFAPGERNCLPPLIFLFYVKRGHPSKLLLETPVYAIESACLFPCRLPFFFYHASEEKGLFPPFFTVFRPKVTFSFFRFFNTDSVEVHSELHDGALGVSFFPFFRIFQAFSTNRRDHFLFFSIWIIGSPPFPKPTFSPIGRPFPFVCGPPLPFSLVA